MKFEDHDEIPYQVYFWDTAGSTDYDRIRIHSYQDAHLCLILFDISNRDSFNNVRTRWLPELTRHCPKVSFIIVGSKIDLRSDPKLQSNTIAKEEGEELAHEVGHHQYTEISARENIGVVELCNAVKLALMTENKEEENSSQKRCAIQ
jgi:small GTP-binding protein